MSYSGRGDGSLSYWRLFFAVSSAVFVAGVALTFFWLVLGAAVGSAMQQQAEKLAFQATHDAQERAVVAEQARLHKQVEDQERQQRAQAAWDTAHALKPNQACIAGTVVEQTFQSNGTPAYVQLVEGTRPVSCSGNRRN